MSDIVEEVKKIITEELENENMEDLEPINEKLKTLRKEVLELYKNKNKGDITEETYYTRYNSLVDEIKELNAILVENANSNIKKQMNMDLKNSILEILSNEGINYNDPQIMRTLIERIVVKGKHTLEFQLAWGINIEDQI